MEKKAIDTLLFGGMVVTMNPTFEVISDGAVAISGSDIVAIGRTADLQARYTACEQVNCANQVILPGLVNAHTHIPMTLLRGLNDDLRLDVWLGYLMAVERQFVTADFVRLGAKLACAEMIQSGITSFADMYYFEDEIAQETAAIGMRALLGQTAIVFPTPDAANHDEAIQLIRRFVANWQGHDLIQPAICPHAWYTSSPEQLAECATLARELDIPLHTHVAETQFEVDNCHAQHGMTVTEWIDKQGLLDTKLLAAHCVHLNRHEMDMLAAAKAGIAHNPTSNLKLSSGIAPVAEMLEAGCQVGIGTDGTASNNDLDMFEEMRLAALVAKVKRSDPVDLPAKEALTLATIGGARAIHLGHLTGSLEVGKRADLLVLNMDGVHNWPHFHSNPEAIYSRIVYAAKSTDVAHTMCHGRWLMRDRQLLTVDLPQAQAAAVDVAHKIDEFVAWRESSPENKLAVLLGAESPDTFEAQIRAKLTAAQAGATPAIITALAAVPQPDTTHTDTYLVLESDRDTAHQLRFRTETQESGATRQILTLLNQLDQITDGISLGQAHYHGAADRPLRFYREYFTPDREISHTKSRQQWHLSYNNVDLVVNIDTVPSAGSSAAPSYFLEIKARAASAAEAHATVAVLQDLQAQLLK